MFKRILLPLLILLPFTTAQAGLLGLDNQIKGEYNLETNKSTLTSQVGKTIGMYGLSVSADVDFDVMEFAYFIMSGTMECGRGRKRRANGASKFHNIRLVGCLGPFLSGPSVDT